MNFAKLIFPLITFPYLTRVLSVDGYGVTTYVRSVMVYFQLLIDFGFLLSATKDVSLNRDNRDEINKIITQATLAKIYLALMAFILLNIGCIYIDLLKENYLYALISFVGITVTCLLPDFLFRGLEVMHILTIRFVISKLVSTILVFVMVHSDRELLLVPVLDLFTSVIALILTLYSIRKLGYNFNFAKVFKGSILQLKNSFEYFVSTIATTAFGAFNTVMIGIYLPVADVANWGIVYNIVTAVQNLYTPITNGVYPKMMQTKDFSLIKKILLIFMPMVTAGCLFIFICSKYIILVISGSKYLPAVPILVSQLPVLFFSFPGQVLGFPTLGAINRVKETTQSTIVAAVFHIFSLVLLVLINKFTIITVSIVRSLTEFIMFLIRTLFCIRYKNEFDNKYN